MGAGPSLAKFLQSMDDDELTKLVEDVRDISWLIRRAAICAGFMVGSPGSSTVHSPNNILLIRSGLPTGSAAHRGHLRGRQGALLRACVP